MGFGMNLLHFLGHVSNATYFVLIRRIRSRMCNN